MIPFFKFKVIVLWRLSITDYLLTILFDATKLGKKNDSCNVFFVYLQQNYESLYQALRLWVNWLYSSLHIFYQSY